MSLLQMIRAAVLSSIVVVGFHGSANAATVYEIYDWSYFAVAATCVGQQYCDAPDQSSASGSGTFTVIQGTANLGQSGVLTSADLQNILNINTPLYANLVDVVESGGVNVPFYLTFPACLNGDPIEICAGDAGQIVWNVLQFTVFAPANVFYSLDSIASVPQPPTWTLLLIGFTGVGLIAYSRGVAMPLIVRLLAFLAFILFGVNRSANAGVILETVSIISSPTNFNGFEGISSSPNYNPSNLLYSPAQTPYTEGGITVRYVGSVPNGGLVTYIHGFESDSQGSYGWYGPGYGYTDVVLQGGRAFASIQFLAGSGLGYGAGNLLYEVLNHGSVVLTGSTPIRDHGNDRGMTIYGFSGGDFK